MLVQSPVFMPIHAGAPARNTRCCRVETRLDAFRSTINAAPAGAARHAAKSAVLAFRVGRSTQTTDTRASTALLSLEYERFREGYSIAPVKPQRKKASDMPRATWEPHEKHGQLTTGSDLPASVYAFPKQRKEPLTDREHVRNAVARFDQVIDVSHEDRDLAFANIQEAARHYGVNLSEASWHELGTHRRKKRTATRRAVT